MSDAKLLELMETVAKMQAAQAAKDAEIEALKKAVADGASKPKSSKDRPKRWYPEGAKVRAFIKRNKTGEKVDVVGYLICKRRYVDDLSPVKFGFTDRDLDCHDFNCDHVAGVLAMPDDYAKWLDDVRKQLVDPAIVKMAIEEARKAEKKRDKDAGLI